MQSLNVVLYQSDSRLAQALASALTTQLGSVYVLALSDELQPAILRHRANVVIVDLELSRLSAVEKLRREFPNLSIVCTHRLADEEMWTAVLAAGGDDILTPTDTRGILQSALRNAAAARAAAA